MGDQEKEHMELAKSRGEDRGSASLPQFTGISCPEQIGVHQVTRKGLSRKLGEEPEGGGWPEEAHLKDGVLSAAPAVLLS